MFSGRPPADSANMYRIQDLMIDIDLLTLEQHEPWMLRALERAQQAFEANEVPVGAIIVHENRIIGEGFNQRESLKDPTAHAEMIAITQAAGTLGSWRLLDCTLYVTLEPCPMCAGAIVLARLPRVVFGTRDPKAGACETLYQITNDPRLNHQSEVRGGVLQPECAGLLQSFFAQQRALGKK
jgi:tRNA(adenine34) deaminase